MAPPIMDDIRAFAERLNKLFEGPAFDPSRRQILTGGSAMVLQTMMPFDVAKHIMQWSPGQVVSGELMRYAAESYMKLTFDYDVPPFDSVAGLELKISDFAQDILNEVMRSQGREATQENSFFAEDGSNMPKTAEELEQILGRLLNQRQAMRETLTQLEDILRADVSLAEKMMRAVDGDAGGFFSKKGKLNDVAYEDLFRWTGRSPSEKNILTLTVEELNDARQPRTMAMDFEELLSYTESGFSDLHDQVFMDLARLTGREPPGSPAHLHGMIQQLRDAGKLFKRIPANEAERKEWLDEGRISEEDATLKIDDYAQARQSVAQILALGGGYSNAPHKGGWAKAIAEAKKEQEASQEAQRA